MTTERKPVSSLTQADFEKHRVWEFARSAMGDETWVKPSRRTPVSKLTGKIVASRVTLANGQRPWALISNVDLDNPKLTKHFVTLSIENEGLWFHLARYHDHDYVDRGPQQLAAFLGFPVTAIFPISYDVSDEVTGDKEAAKGMIPLEPEEKLTRAEIIALAVP